MLITLPDSSTELKYLSKWSEYLIKTAEKNGIRVIPVKGDNVNKSHIINDINSKNPRFINFNGHGSETFICGQNNEVLIQLGENDKLLKDRIIHSLTCSSATKLGVECKAKAYIGYNGLFFFCMDGNSLTRPLEDRFATPILDSAFEISIQIVKKKTVKEAFDHSQKKYQKWIDEYTVSESKYTTEELQFILPYLYWDKTIQTFIGDTEARIG